MCQILISLFFFSLDLVENFDEASKNEANWTKHHFLNKVKTWKGNMELLFYIVTALIFFFFSWWYLNICDIWKLLEPAAL